MATCKECICYESCLDFAEMIGKNIVESITDGHYRCEFIKDRSRFVELKHAKWDEHEDMNGDPFYRCSNCRESYFLEEWTPIENRYFYCPNCSAKMDEQALKEREA